MRRSRTAEPATPGGKRKAAAATALVLAAAASVPAATGTTGRTPERTLAYVEAGRTYGCIHYYPVYEREDGKVRVQVREAKTKMRLLILGAEVDFTAEQIYMMPPGSDKVLGFALKQRTREVTQFTEAALTPKGLLCRVIRNGEIVLDRTLPVPPETIIPAEMSFIPKLVRRAGGKGGKAVVVAPDTLALVEMQITPAGVEEITVAGKKRTAARFDVVAGARGTPPPLRIRQRLYFDPQTDELLLSVEDDPSARRRRRVELSIPAVESRLRRLRRRGDSIRPKPLPWRDGDTIRYEVLRDGVRAGEVRISVEDAGDGRIRLRSERTLGTDTEKASTLVDAEAHPISYSLEGKALLASATGEPVEKPYSLRCTFEPRKIIRLTGGADAREKSERPLDGNVFLFDRNAPGLYALAASQLDLALGRSATLGVYHARDGEASLITFTVTSSGEDVRGTYFIVHLRSKKWIGTMTVAADGTLLRADRNIGGTATFEYVLKRK